MKPIKNILIADQGQVLLAFLLVSTVLLGFSAIALDIGVSYVSQAKLQNIADSVATAAAQDIENPSAAIYTALVYSKENGFIAPDPIPQNLSSPYEYSNPSTGEKIIITTPYSNDETKIEVICSSNVTFSFAKVFGISEGNVQARAVAQYGIAASVPWIVPFVIPQPIEFNYDNTYVMRMYGGGPYPNNYQYPSDYRNDPVYKSYPISGTPTNNYTTINQANLKSSASNYSSTLTVIPTNKSVTYNYSKKVGSYYNYTTWYNVSYSGYTGFIKANDVQKKTLEASGNIYPYHFDYMNVHIKNESGFSEYIKWLENGYHDTFSINEIMYYYAPSSGGKSSVDAFYKRTTKDTNTDYSKAKIGDARVILIPIVEELLPRSTSDGTPMPIIGFTAFFIEKVHKNSYGTSFWFEGRFLKDLKVNSNNISNDPNADYGLRIIKLIE